MRVCLLFTVVLLAGGAAAAPRVAPTPLGAAVNRNIEVLAGDMHPQYRGTPIEGSTGKTNADAVARYRSDQVTQPIQASSTSGIRMIQQPTASTQGVTTSQ